MTLQQPQRPAPAKPQHERQPSIEDFTVYKPGGFVQRWYALTLDLAFFAPLNVLVHLPFVRHLERLSAFGFDTRHMLLEGLLSALPILLYFIAPTLLWGQTLGKYIVGLRVVRSSFSPELTLSQVLVRETIGKLLSLATFGFGFLMVVFNSRKRALHDHVSETQVIAYRPR